MGRVPILLRAEREEKTDSRWKPSALLLCARPQDAQVIRSVLGGLALSVDQCFESYTAERLIKAQPYAVMLFDLETPGAGELMQNMRQRTGGALQIALASRSAAVDRVRLGAELVFRPVNEERMAVELGRVIHHGGPQRRAGVGTMIKPVSSFKFEFQNRLRPVSSFQNQFTMEKHWRKSEVSLRLTL